MTPIKKYVGLFLIVNGLTFNQVFCQYKTYQPGSIQESYLLMSNKDAINGFRFYPQTRELLNLVTQTLDYTTETRQLALLPGLRHNKASQYFYYNHPEYNGRIRAGIGAKSWVKNLGENSLWASPSWFYSYRDSANPSENYFVINPIVDFESGPPKQFGRQLLNNGRGAEVIGKIGGRVAFTTQVYENQVIAREYTQNTMDSFGVIPGVGFWTKNGWNLGDYLSARSSVHTNLVNTASDKNYVLMSFGHDNQFVGYGYRSLILSNFSPASAYLRLNSKIGPFTYQNIFRELTTGEGFFSGSQINEKKYLAAHRGALEFGKTGFELGFNEMIIHHRSGGGMDLNYLNPIIFYRSIERDLGSGDNALIAFDARWKKKAFTFYGQLLIDELNVKKVIQGNHWSNKQAYQLGCYFQPNLPEYGDFVMQVELNSVRPYTYSHWDKYTSYNHYNQALAHPLGSNFREGIVRVVLKPKHVTGFVLIHTTMIAIKGFDPYVNGPNYGGNILRSYNSRVRDENVYMQQGELGRILNTKTQLLYEVMPNMWFTLNAQYRTQSNVNKSSEYYFSLGWKWNWFEETQLF
ncbi:MAG: hypothetical protein RLZZ47_270 [Bacteroidota bacterium]|jgi:hypothetical protein